jgi:hypothetical protein
LVPALEVRRFGAAQDAIVDVKALAERARAETGVPQKIWELCMAKVS